LREDGNGLSIGGDHSRVVFWVRGPASEVLGWPPNEPRYGPTVRDLEELLGDVFVKLGPISVLLGDRS
jgi:hypothetical protein